MLDSITGPAEWADLSIHNPDDVDFFRFEVLPGGDQYYLDVLFLHDDADLDVALYDESQALVRSGESETDNERLDLRGLEPGTYFVEVYSIEGAANYRLSISAAEPVALDRFEPNGTWESAAVLDSITGPAEWADLSIHNPDDVDFFRFEVLPGGDQYYLDVLFLHDDADLDVALYDESQALVRSGESETDNERLDLRGLEPGTYVEVYSIRRCRQLSSEH